MILVCNEVSCCCHNEVKAPESDTPNVVRKYWAYASLLNGTGKMIDSMGGHLQNKDLDESTHILITYVISALVTLEARTKNEIKKQREEATRNGKGKCKCESCKRS